MQYILSTFFKINVKIYFTNKIKILENSWKKKWLYILTNCSIFDSGSFHLWCYSITFRILNWSSENCVGELMDDNALLNHADIVVNSHW
jgi:hypothetical protein